MTAKTLILSQQQRRVDFKKDTVYDPTVESESDSSARSQTSYQKRYRRVEEESLEAL